MKLPFICACLVLCSFPRPALAVPIPVLGAVKQPDGVLLRMQPGLLKVGVCTDSIMRVVYSPTGSLPPTLQNFAVIQKWTPIPYDLKVNPGDIAIRTGKITVKVNRATGAVQFFDAGGRPLLRELADGGKSMPPATVNGEQSYQPEQSFLSPDDEVLYGLGQVQDGTWNWRGMPLRLEQQNTNIALPVLISNKGYGLFWNNAAITDFNPADNQVPIDPKIHQGTYTTGQAGDCVFMVREGDRRGEIGLNIDGQNYSDIKNKWVPYSVSSRLNLAANQTCTVKLLGGGANAKVYARPLGHTTTFRSDVGDAIDYYFFYGPEPDGVVANFRLATGAAPLFPKWAYGFWQCRAWYVSQAQLLAAAAEFRKRQIPIDLIVQDWRYWGKYGFGAYQFDETNYPDPAGMIKTLHDEHIKFMITNWSNPAGEAGKALAQAKVVIPGQVNPWIDEFSPVARKIRWDFMNKAFFSIGTDAWWQDATEPSDAGRMLLGLKTYFGSGNRFNNAYPLFASMGTYQGQRAVTEKKRFCLLTRSGYPGQQRYATAVWSGDIHGDWITFKRQIAGGLNLSVTGMPYWCTDTAGFFRPDDQYTSPDYNELLVRWFQFSTFSPILRIHGMMTETEMWKFLPKTQEQLLAYDQLRHRLLPYSYSVAWMVTHGGYTIMRPLVMDFRADPKAQMVSDEFMYGPAFLVAPVTVPGRTSPTRPVYLPAGTDWINFWTGEKFTGGQTVEAPAPLDQIPLYVRAGSIIPFGPEVQYADEKPADPIELRIYPGADGQFTLYEDEDDNYDYEKGVYATLPFTWSDHNQTLLVAARHGRFPGMLDKRTFQAVRVSTGHGTGMGPTDHPDVNVSYSGQPATALLPVNK
jgi:alpha-D-xyloside xylohydrolase